MFLCYKENRDQLSERVFHVKKSALDEIPERFRVYKNLQVDWDEETKWSNEYTTFQRQSIKDSEEYPGYLEVIFREIK